MCGGNGICCMVLLSDAVMLHVWLSDGLAISAMGPQSSMYACAAICLGNCVKAILHCST